MPTDPDAHRRPSAVYVEVYDPLDNAVLMSIRAPYRRAREHARIIRGLPAMVKRLGRADGTPIGIRTLKTRTRLVYHD